MKFTLPGQLKGPECRTVISRAIQLRKRLEPVFEKIDGGSLEKIAIALRVDGSLGSFGAESVENIIVKQNCIECDLIVGDHGWNELSEKQIDLILNQRVINAIKLCFEHVDLSVDLEEVESCLHTD